MKGQGSMLESASQRQQNVSELERRGRAETVVKALATLQAHGDSLAEVAHDARNMVAALGLYCDLLEEPGVLAIPFAHYAHELRLVAAASHRLVEKLVALDTTAASEAFPPAIAASSYGSPAPLLHDGAGTCQSCLPFRDRLDWAIAGRPQTDRRTDLIPALPINNLAAEVLACRNLLAALAGPGIVLTVDTEGGAQPVRLNGEDLTRVLVNLVKNAAEAMPSGGRIHVSLYDRSGGQGAAPSVALLVEDSGPGIPSQALTEIFASGFTTHGKCAPGNNGWPHSHRGLGLAITRSIIEGAGGRITASNRDRGGARFSIELPVRKEPAIG